MNRPDKSFLTAVLLLVLMAVLAGGAARRESVTVDELAHTGAGVSYLQALDMRLNAEHPPLAKILAAIPLVVRGAHADYMHLSWTFSGSGRFPFFRQFLGEWVFGHWFLMTWNDPHTTLYWARIPMLLLTLLLGLALYVMGTQLGDFWGGLLCLAAYTTMPAFLAFGPLVITDLAVTLFWVMTVWQLPNMWRNPSRGLVIKFGLALAGALLSKFSSGLLFFVFPAFALSLRLMPLAEQPTNKGELRSWRRRGWISLAKGTLWAALFVYVVYLVLSWRQSTDSFSVIPYFPASPVFRRMLMPAWLYLQGVVGFGLTALSRPTYLLGRVYPHGVWFYFPVLFLLKSQLAFLLLLALSLVAAVAVKARFRSRYFVVTSGMEMHWRAVWVSLIVFVAVCLINRLDISIRHFMIALALIILLLAPLPRTLRTLTTPYSPVGVTTTALITAMCVAMIVTAVRAYPNYVPFVNSLGMGHPVHELVNDSNVDWNQSLPEAEVFARRHGLHQLLLDEYGFSNLSVYIPQAQPWDCQQPTESNAGQWAVLSANFLGESGTCGWLLQYPHEILAGGSLYAVHLPELIPSAGQAGGPPLPQDYRNFGGAPFDLRPIFQRCIRDPGQLEPTMDWVKSSMAPEGKKK